MREELRKIRVFPDICGRVHEKLTRRWQILLRISKLRKTPIFKRGEFRKIRISPNVCCHEDATPRLQNRSKIEIIRIASKSVNRCLRNPSYISWFSRVSFDTTKRESGDKNPDFSDSGIRKSLNLRNADYLVSFRMSTIMKKRHAAQKIPHSSDFEIRKSFKLLILKTWSMSEIRKIRIFPSVICHEKATRHSPLDKIRNLRIALNSWKIRISRMSVHTK